MRLEANVYLTRGKRVLDVVAAGCGAILLSPVMLAIALAVRITMGRVVIFRQQRPGINGRPFTILKFRTMRDERDATGQVRPDHDRLSRFGRFLRATSLDELPELFSVVKGDMSIVGPRPLLMQYLDRYTSEQARRHKVRPGMTGWAQVNGRNALTWEQKLALDVWYVDHVSLVLDLKIIAVTVWKILKREGISQPGQATVEEFRGNPR